MEEEKGCTRNCLSRCCLLRQDARFALYAFSKMDRECTGPVENKEVKLSFLDKLLEQWKDRMHRGLFHYDITSFDRKVIQGEYGFITQLIEGRDQKKRPTEYRADKVLQTFDGTKFNFMKIGREEALFRFGESVKDESQYFHDASILATDSRNVIAINRMDRESFLLALYLSTESGSPYFKVGYNSLGAFATINHLHFQAFYLPMLLPAEKAETEATTTLESGVRILRLLSYPVQGLAFERGGKASLEDLADAVSNACSYLQDNNHPYNVLISDCGKRVFLFLQCYAEKRSHGEVSQEITDNQVNPAVWEISGYMVLKRKKDYEEATQESVLSFLSLVSVSEERFKRLQVTILDAVRQGESRSKT